MEAVDVVVSAIEKFGNMKPPKYDVSLPAPHSLTPSSQAYHYGAPMSTDSCGVCHDYPAPPEVGGEAGQGDYGQKVRAKLVLRDR